MSGPVGVRDLVVQQVKDLRRTLDYLETREHVDSDRVAFHGLSYGGVRSMFILAVETRFRTALIVSTGLVATRRLPPEIQQVDYLPRVTLPFLFVTGRNDLSVPYETAQRPFFELLGTPDDEKKHVALDWGHLPPGYSELTRSRRPSSAATCTSTPLCRPTASGPCTSGSVLRIRTGSLKTGIPR